MFWSEDELEELNGTAVVGPSSCIITCPELIPSADKIGKAQAEEDYYNKIVPVMKVALCDENSVLHMIDLLLLVAI
jgi:hypothetical protein